jgi:hypothetical protein
VSGATKLNLVDHFVTPRCRLVVLQGLHNENLSALVKTAEIELTTRHAKAGGLPPPTGTRWAPATYEVTAYSTVDLNIPSEESEA